MSRLLKSVATLQGLLLGLVTARMFIGSGDGGAKEPRTPRQRERRLARASRIHRMATPPYSRMGGKAKEKVQHPLRTRSVKSYTEDTRNVIKLVTTSNRVKPVGSFKYHAHRYPGDIDIFEKIKVSARSKRDAADQIAQRLQKLAGIIYENPTVFLGDFKAGQDKRFDVDLGHWDNDELVGYTGYKVINTVQDWRKRNLITMDESHHIQGFARSANLMTLNDHASLQEAIRDLHVVRWSLDELRAGVKHYRGKKLYLADAISDGSTVKIDVWAHIDGNYNEVTNWFYLLADTSEGREEPVVLSAELGKYETSILHDIVHYACPSHLNLLKSVKRLWMLAVAKKWRDLINAFNPLWRSDAAALNQIIARSEVARDMLAALEYPPFEALQRQISHIKPAIEQFNDAQYLKNDMLFAKIDEAVHVMPTEPQKTITLLKELEKHLRTSVNTATKTWLREHHLSDYIETLRTRLGGIRFEACL